MNKKSFALPIVSLIISIVAFFLYGILLNGTNVYILWILLSMMSVVFPIISKYFRNKYKQGGKAFEIAALVIGVCDFYFVFFAATKVDLYLVLALMIAICVLYAKLFNHIPSTDSQSLPSTAAPRTAVPTADQVCFCRKCGEKLRQDRRFCHKCGTEIKLASEIGNDTPPIINKAPATVWICEKCRTKNLSTRNDCWSCGTPSRTGSRTGDGSPS